ncbi:hypothetical protein ABC347_09165 [Sphingomonas sp. 1P06PA]|uniref:FliH/SctL family protein n=1 Tax=Sphingomonas sp. 1P06PA TaxID=554121 RepID=UPI0039A51641
MSFVLIHADRAGSVLADDPIVPAAEIERFAGAIDLLRGAGAVRDGIAAEQAAAIAEARAEGHAEGLAAGRAEARKESEAALFQLTVKAAAERRQQHADVTALAIEVVRRIAQELGPEMTVAAIADRATADLLPDSVATVRVSPAAVAATEQRLASRPGLRVEGDAALAATDCIVETALGTTRAGLETQLAAIARAWDDAAAQPEAAA